MRKRRGRTRMVRRRRSVNRPGGTPETTWEAGWLSCSGLGLPDQPAPSSLDPSRWSVCEVHDPTGEPGAGNPHAGFGERGTGNAAMGAGLRPGAKATDKPPDPNAGAPAPDSTQWPAHTLAGEHPFPGRRFREAVQQNVPRSRLRVNLDLSNARKCRGGGWAAVGARSSRTDSP